jgi:hypothetical protein
MSNNADLAGTYSYGRVSFLFLGHGSSFPARVIVARHTDLRRISAIRRQAAACRRTCQGDFLCE